MIAVDDLQQTDPAPAALPKEAPAQKAVPPVPRHQSVALELEYLRTLIGPEFRPVLGMVAITVLIGTIFYRIVEGWGMLDSMYFSVVTLATIGFGDLAPATRLGKAFTIVYVFAGVGTLGLFLSAVARSSTRHSLEADRNRALLADRDELME